MTETTKRVQPKQKVKAEAPKKAEAVLNETQLDQVTGGAIAEACATGKHFPKGTVVG